MNRAPACRAETRSQGIATKICLTRTIDGKYPLQSRDPFSGDCDPVGRIQDEEDRPHQLAEPRPVLRGLRRLVAYSSFPRNTPRACRAETRSQGIATLGRVLFLPSQHPPRLQSRDPFSGDCDDMISSPIFLSLIISSCRAETRSQGIATVAALERMLRG